MIVDFDPAKDAANRARHGVPLAFGARVFEDPRLAIRPTLRLRDEEDRFKAIGRVDGKMWTAIHVWRGGTPRMISVRRSNAGEQREYHSNTS